MSETDARPMNCRNRIRDNGLPYPRSGCAACGNGGLMGCPYERAAPSPRERELEEALAAARELLSHIKLHVMEKLEPEDADMLHDRMADLTRALTPEAGR